MEKNYIGKLPTQQNKSQEKYYTGTNNSETYIIGKILHRKIKKQGKYYMDVM